jgi:hypothetical protein
VAAGDLPRRENLPRPIAIYTRMTDGERESVALMLMMANKAGGGKVRQINPSGKIPLPPSPRPLCSRSANEMQNFGQIMPRERDGVWPYHRHCEQSEAIHLTTRRKNGLLRCIRKDVERAECEVSKSQD